MTARYRTPGSPGIALAFIPTESRSERNSPSGIILAPYSLLILSTISSLPAPNLSSAPMARMPPGVRTLAISARPALRSGQKKYGWP